MLIANIFLHSFFLFQLWCIFLICFCFCFDTWSWTEVRSLLLSLSSINFSTCIIDIIKICSGILVAQCYMKNRLKSLKYLKITFHLTSTHVFVNFSFTFLVSGFISVVQSIPNGIRMQVDLNSHLKKLKVAARKIISSPFGISMFKRIFAWPKFKIRTSRINNSYTWKL